MVPAHSDDLLPGLLQGNVDTMVRLLPGVPSITFLKKSLYQDAGHARREEDSTELETIPCTYSDATKAEERADQLFPGTASFLTFSKSRVHPRFSG